MKYNIETFTIPDGSPGGLKVPSISLSKHFIATPPTWSTRPDKALREIPRITHKPSGALVTDKALGPVRRLRYIAAILEAIPINWDSIDPKWEDMPGWVRNWLQVLVKGE